MPKEMDANKLKTFYTKDNKLVIRTIILPPANLMINPIPLVHPQQLSQMRLNGSTSMDLLNKSFPDEFTIPVGMGHQSSQFQAQQYFQQQSGHYFNQPPASAASGLVETFFVGPSIKAEDISITVQEGVVCIEAQNTSGGKHVRQERYYKEFILPAHADEEKLVSKFKDGVLTLTAPMKVTPTMVDRFKSNLQLNATDTINASARLCSANKYQEELAIDPCFNPQNIEIGLHEDHILIRGHVNKLDPTTGRTHSSHSYRHDIQVPNTVDTSKLSARWLEDHRILIEAPFVQTQTVGNFVVPSMGNNSWEAFLGYAPNYFRVLHNPKAMEMTNADCASTPAMGDQANDGEMYSVKLKLATEMKPSELNVHVDEQNVLHIEGKHEEDKNGHKVNRTLRKQHTLPKNVISDRLTAFWLEGGFVLVEAPLKVTHDNSDDCGVKHSKVPLKVSKK